MRGRGWGWVFGRLRDPRRGARHIGLTTGARAGVLGAAGRPGRFRRGCWLPGPGARRLRRARATAPAPLGSWGFGSGLGCGWDRAGAYRRVGVHAVARTSNRTNRVIALCLQELLVLPSPARRKHAIATPCDRSSGAGDAPSCASCPPDPSAATARVCPIARETSVQPRLCTWVQPRPRGEVAARPDPAGRRSPATRGPRAHPAPVTAALRQPPRRAPRASRWGRSSRSAHPRPRRTSCVRCPCTSCP